jgi:two-component system cell cycle sensor histidine kinase/response regulator CckA
MQTVAKERVLVVDDEPQILVALEDLLSERFIVFKTDSAEGALRMMERERDIAVLITDQRMPRMNGDELLATMGTASDTQRIMLTGFADLSAVIRAVNEGRVFSYVTKPWSPQDLQIKVQTAAEHFRLARELAYERQLLHDLMDNIPDGIYFKDHDLRFRRANRSFAAMAGSQKPERVVGRRLEDVFPALSSSEITDSEEQRVLSTGEAVVDVVREYRWNGQQHWLSETKAPIRGPDGSIVGLVGVARDVTERVKTQEALRESEAHLRDQTRVLNSILSGMGDGVIAVDRSGAVLVFNSRARQILGEPPTGTLPNLVDVYGMRDADGVMPLSVEQDPLIRAMNGEVVDETELTIRNATTAGAIIALKATALLDEDDNLTGGIVLLRDVTQQRNLERQLTQAQKMEAVGRLAGGIAHDFNNLLAVILCYGSILLEEFPVDTRCWQDVKELLAAGDRAAALTKQLLAFSRRRVVTSSIVQLNDVVSDVEKMLRRLLGEDIDMRTELSPGLGTVRADAGQLEQIILNLSINARDAMPDGGKITIETQNVTLNDEYAESHAKVVPGEYTMLAVTDTGVGMDAQTQRRIFEPFFTTKDVGKGTGLGLSTVYGIVQQSGGHVWVYSEVQRGTSFKVYLPRVDEVGGAAPVRPQAVAPPRGTETILLVEDDEAVRRVAIRILAACGYNVLEAKRATDARRICAEMGATIDLLLTDVVMPEISGLKLAQELLEAHPRLRVLYMSGYPGGAVAHEGILAADTAYLEKPFSAAGLAQKVRAALET